MSRYGNPQEVMQIGQTIQGIAQQVGQLAEQAARTISAASDWNDGYWAQLNGEVSAITSPIQTGADNLTDVASRIISEASKYE